MSNDNVSLELGAVRGLARERLEEIVTGLVAYGLERSEAEALLEGVVEEAIETVYGEGTFLSPLAVCTSVP